MRQLGAEISLSLVEKQDNGSGSSRRVKRTSCGRQSARSRQPRPMSDRCKCGHMEKEHAQGHGRSQAIASSAAAANRRSLWSAPRLLFERSHNASRAEREKSQWEENLALASTQSGASNYFSLSCSALRLHVVNSLGGSLLNQCQAH